MSDTFCVLPWIHLSTQPNGNAVLCCEADHIKMKSASHDRRDESASDGYPYFYTLSKDSIQHLINSQSFCDVRKKMLVGKRPEACLGCYYKEDAGVLSKRQKENENFANFTFEYAKSITKDDGSIDPDIRFAELRLGNACNLRCVTCNPSSSSQWREDWVKLQSLDFVKNRYKLDNDGNWLHTKYIEFRWPESEMFWEEFIQHTQNLEVVYINGGEPLLNKQHIKFLEQAIESGRAKDIILQYSINLTIVPDKLVDLWKEFKKVKIGCSIDDVGKRNEYIRYPSDWNQTIENYYKLKDLSWLETTIVQTVSAYNYLYLDQLYNLINDDHTYIYYNFVKDPAYMSPLILPQDLRLKTNRTLKQTLPTYVTNQLDSLFSKEQDVESYKKFVSVTKELDLIRKTSFNEIFPELEACLR